MILKNWMQMEGITQLDLARILDVSGSSISNATRGVKPITSVLALKIVEISKGTVSFEEALFPDHYIEKTKNGSTQTRLVPKRESVISSDKFDLLEKLKGKKLKKPNGSSTSKISSVKDFQVKFDLYKEEMKKITCDLQTQIFILRKDVNQLKFESNNIHSSIKRAQ